MSLAELEWERDHPPKKDTPASWEAPHSQVVAEKLPPHIFPALRDGKRVYMTFTEDGRLIEVDRQGW